MEREKDTSYYNRARPLRPTVRCGCGSPMEPTSNATFPYEWACTGDCDGHVDIEPPTQGWGQQRCGVVLPNGSRCGAGLIVGTPCCGRCMRAMALEMCNREDGRAAVLEHLGKLIEGQIHREAQQRYEAELREKREAARSRRQDTSGHVVYYARLGHNHIKIGTTGDLPRRMVELRVVNPSNLLAAEPGDHTVEHERHQQFRKWQYQRRKEDFGEAPELLEHIRKIREEHGPPYELASRLADKIAPH